MAFNHINYQLGEQVDNQKEGTKITYPICNGFKILRNYINATKQLLKRVVFMFEVSLLTVESKIGFQSFVVAMHHFDMNTDLYAHINALSAILHDSQHLDSTHTNPQSPVTWKFLKTEQAGRLPSPYSV